MGSTDRGTGRGGGRCGLAFGAAVGTRHRGICAVNGFCGAAQSSSWAPTVMALGMVAWFVGHWSFAVRNDVHYRSRLARVVIDKTLLRWTVPRYWQLRRQRRLAAAR